SVRAQEDVFAMFASLRVEEKTGVDMLPVVHEFVDVFPDDILDLPPEREVE
ncbi:cellular nucleic acid-binding protein, partial [Trifolium medium]|nr:cellular nucleic acid-binding protein [Trifolium medium]